MPVGGGCCGAPAPCRPTSLTAATHRRPAPAAPAQAAAEEGEEAEAAGASYDYLLSMPLSSLTLEKVQGLQSEAEETRGHVERLRATTEKQMWRDDLDAFQQAGGVVG